MVYNKFVVIFILLCTNLCYSQDCNEYQSSQQQNNIKTTKVDQILKDLDLATSKLKTYQGRFEYNFSQPLLDSQTFRTGYLSFKKNNTSSHLRINFETIKEDNEKTQKYMEHIIFDGIWLIHIDFQTEHVKKIQQAEPNNPIDALELARQHFPIIGFTRIPELKKQFDISLIDQEQNEQDSGTRLLLKVKPDSIYKDDYTQINFLIDKKLNLPTEIIATTVESEIHQIKLLKPVVNKKLPEKIFEAKIPENFDIEFTPLKQK